MLNFLIPILSWSFIWTDNSNALNECLGKGYLKFLSIKGHYCTEDNILCWAWLFLVIILISNIIDVYCIYQCIKDIKKSTEKSRNMLSKQAYTNRKRFDDHTSYDSNTNIIFIRRFVRVGNHKVTKI